MLQIQALIKILTKQGKTTKDEILREVFKLKLELEEKINNLTKTNLIRYIQDICLRKKYS